MVKNNRPISLICLSLFIVVLLVGSNNTYYKSSKFNHRNPFFYEMEEKKIEYEGYFYPYSYREIWQNIDLSIMELYSLKNGNLYALQLEQLEVSNPLDEIKLGRRYLGYFYVTDQIIYYMPSSVEGYTNEKNREIIDCLQTNEKKFCDDCYIVCCESGTRDIMDENGYHSFVEVDGERRIFRYYNDYFYGSKEYLLIVWEKEKGIVYYMRGNGAMNMHVEFGVDLKREQLTDYGNPYRMFH